MPRSAGSPRSSPRTPDPRRTPPATAPSPGTSPTERSYRSLYDAGTGFFRGRDADGEFAPGFDPRAWGGDNVETNAWGMSVGAVHDGHGLAALHGGPGGLGRHLDALFAEPETAEERFGGAYGAVIHEQREARALRSGMCAISNQPAHHIPFMYAFSDRPWRAGRSCTTWPDACSPGRTSARGSPATRTTAR
ncbi:glycoside hydrolase domain-containing protein [Microbacterium sp. Se63.02b]|uniref:glycoside hydrolase domain-containing protein n=1 Tax=Microbacterium sp. Se63.02b TaxID=2709304 RepID=UPI00237B7272|nr:glycoside hydrolase domain-containing protein [Microbacterium sp. Se63.02b]